ncbi:MAG TPA: SDR family oxidoreductase [Acidobacteriaceae bacterium]|jgi:nucleoside-diphosphate-sugar epimerase
MRIFLTGATGFVGSAVTQELLKHGHQVLGLARSDANAAALTAAGAQPHRGDLQDLGALRSGALQSDATIHCGFIHDFSKFQENCDIDALAIETMGNALAGSNKPFIVTSGTALLTGTGGTTEDVPAPPPSAAVPRVSEAAAFAFTDKGVRTAAIRLPPSVHGAGDHGFIPILINLARQKGAAAYIGEGQNRWPAVHRFDAAVLYRLAIEKAQEKGTTGAVYHSVADTGVPFREIAAVIGRGLNVPVVSKTPDEAKEHFGWFAHFAGIDNLASSEWTRKQLGWTPTQPGLLADMEKHYFSH